MLRSKLDCDGFIQVHSFLWCFFVKSGCFLEVILKSPVFLVVVAT